MARVSGSPVPSQFTLFIHPSAASNKTRRQAIKSLASTYAVLPLLYQPFRLLLNHPSDLNRSRRAYVTQGNGVNKQNLSTGLNVSKCSLIAAKDGVYPSDTHGLGNRGARLNPSDLKVETGVKGQPQLHETLSHQ